MLRGLFGSTTLPAMLRGGLEEASATHRGIAERVAGALTTSSSTSFSSALDAAQAAPRHAEADLQQDMASLADTEIRYEASSRLLQQAYGRIRTAIRTNV